MFKWLHLNRHLIVWPKPEDANAHHVLLAAFSMGFFPSFDASLVDFYWQFCIQSFLSPPSASEEEAFQHHNTGYCFCGKLCDLVWRLNKMGVVTVDNRCQIGPCGSVAQCKFLPFSVPSLFYVISCGFLQKTAFPKYS